MSNNLGVLDLGALLLLVVFGVLGGVKGAVRIIFGLVSLSAGYVLAAQYGGSLKAETWPIVKGFEDPAQVGGLVGCALVFILVILVGALLGRMLRKALSESNLGGMDRLIGMLLGLAQGALWVAALVILLKALNLPPVNAELDRSLALEATRQLAANSPGIASGKIRDFIDTTLELPPEDDP